MKRFLFSLLIIASLAFSCTAPDDGPEEPKGSKLGTIDIKNISSYNYYYKDIDGVKSANLKSELHDLIDNHKVLPYTSSSFDVWDALKQTDEDPKNPNNIILLYTGRSQNKNTQDNGHNGDDVWNREHVWAKSLGFGGDPDISKPASTDIHHLRPADRSVNTARSNKYFGEGGSPHSEATGCYYTSTTWEPRDAVKGDVARMMFYMAVRYEGYNGNPDLELNDRVSRSGPNIGKLSALLEWHKQDPVDAFEIKRNQTIFEIQGNRNPFIDHPEFVEYIW
ncbi:ribonuclease [Ancylomarina euxinus]|uniref:Ribonuclease n=1 Tax=Ancylomarina euxinus TaxID=2283627 RepID=A0A425Y7Q0_9BACT|nr:endonuclease [Ancylomarina euxinus]MCZ4693540.1 endonuclease [Ancylomarina euxinus]MUP13767.1 ribonuclease [Ancylomarina euxinus]RRG24595.1 ribonuclease [Ancylomarina euxinus]